MKDYVFVMVLFPNFISISPSAVQKISLTRDMIEIDMLTCIVIPRLLTTIANPPSRPPICRGMKKPVHRQKA